MKSKHDIRGRALTDEQKREVLDRILAAWRVTPDLRLGQLICNSTAVDLTLYQLEDDDLAAKVEDFATPRRRV
jgi:hypothetical protein